MYILAPFKNYINIEWQIKAYAPILFTQFTEKIMIRPIDL